MNIGMLWFDNDPNKSLNEKIEKATIYYQKKYGKTPNQCIVNPEMYTEDGENSQSVKVIASPTIMPHHIWIGYDSTVKKVRKSN